LASLKENNFSSEVEGILMFKGKVWVVKSKKKIYFFLFSSSLQAGGGQMQAPPSCSDLSINKKDVSIAWSRRWKVVGP